MKVRIGHIVRQSIMSGLKGSRNHLTRQFFYIIPKLGGDFCNLVYCLVKV
jgi:hypothetical protein